MSLGAGDKGSGSLGVAWTWSPRIAFGAALGTAALLVWVIGAVGLIGAEGDPFDRLYAGVIAVAGVGALAARFRPAGMERALYGAAAAQILVVAAALIVGKQHHPVSSVPEIVLSNGFFVALWIASARLFRAVRKGERSASG